MRTGIPSYLEEYIESLLGRIEIHREYKVTWKNVNMRENCGNRKCNYIMLFSAHYLQPTGGNGEVILSPSCTAGSVSNPSVVPLTAINSTTICASGSSTMPSSCVSTHLQNCISLVGPNGSISPTLPSAGCLTPVVANGVPPNYPLYYPPPQFTPCYPVTTTRSAANGLENAVTAARGVANRSMVNSNGNTTA